MDLVRRLSQPARPALAFLAARFDRGGALGLSLTVAVAVIVATGWAFGEVAENVIERDDLAARDGTITGWLVAQRNDALTDAMQVLTNLGAFFFVVPLAVIVAVAVPAGWGRRRTVLLVLVLTAGTSLIVNAIKLLIGRPRPTLEEVLATATGYAFPSGHSAQAMVAYATLAYLLTRRWRRRSVAVVAWTTAAAVALVVGFSRMYLGVHWMTDVIGGYLLAAAWMVTVLTAVHTVATLRGRSETRRRSAPAAR